MGELLHSLSAEELTEWHAYAELEPFDETRMDWRFGVLTALVANLFRGEGQAAIDPGQFVPDFAGDRARDREERRAELQEQQAEELRQTLQLAKRRMQT